MTTILRRHSGALTIAGAVVLVFAISTAIAYLVAWYVESLR